MNPAKNISAIIKDKVEESIANEDRRNRYNHDVLKTNLGNTLKGLKVGIDLFIDLLCSTSIRFDALDTAEGDHTEF